MDVRTLKEKIEKARKLLEDSIGNGADPKIIYKLSVDLDELIEKYIQSATSR